MKSSNDRIGDCCGSKAPSRKCGEDFRLAPNSGARRTSREVGQGYRVSGYEIGVGFFPSRCYIKILNGPVPKVRLDCAGVLTIGRKLELVAVAQHVAMNQEAEPAAAPVRATAFSGEPRSDTNT
jgi:hypothetical protein